MIFLFSIFFFIILGPKVSAQDIQTGQASAKSSVTTNINGSGDVYTKIEVEANGEKKELETNKQGTHTLEVSTEESTDEAELDEETKIKPVFVMQKILEIISQFFKKFLPIFS